MVLWELPCSVVSLFVSLLFLSGDLVLGQGSDVGGNYPDFQSYPGYRNFSECLGGVFNTNTALTCILDAADCETNNCLCRSDLEESLRRTDFIVGLYCDQSVNYGEHLASASSILTNYCVRLGYTEAATVTQAAATNAPSENVSSPTPGSSPSDSNSDSGNDSGTEDDRLSLAEKIGIGVGAAGVLATILVGYVTYKKSRNN